MVLTVRFIAIDGIVVRINCCLLLVERMIHAGEHEMSQLIYLRGMIVDSYWSELKRGREAEVREHRGRGRIGAK